MSACICDTHTHTEQRSINIPAALFLTYVSAALLSLPVYRLAFHQTFPEMKQKSNEWKTVMGGIFIFMGLTGLVTWWQSIYGKSSPPFFFFCTSNIFPNFMDLISQFQCRKEPLERYLKGKDDDKPSACHVLTLALWLLAVSFSFCLVLRYFDKPKML